MTITDLWKNQLKSEFMMNINQTFAQLANDGIKYNQIAQQQTKIAGYMNDCLDEEWVQTRGLEIESVGINNITLAPEDKDKIDKIDEMHLMSDTTNAAGRMTSAMANALEGAAENEGGAFMGFAGLNAAGGAAGAQVNNLHQMASQEQAEKQVKTQNKITWKCKCGTENTGKFCTECGNPKPSTNEWACSCGVVNSGKFCTECGSPKPLSKTWKCDVFATEIIFKRAVDAITSIEHQLSVTNCPNCGALAVLIQNQDVVISMQTLVVDSIVSLLIA